MKFELTSNYRPTGDQPEAIRQLTDGITRGDAAHVLFCLLYTSPSPRD